MSPCTCGAMVSRGGRGELRAWRLVERWCFARQAWGIVEDVCAKSMVDMHFAWQAWGRGCKSALEKELDAGSAWEAWGNGHFSVAWRAFRVAGVGNCGHRSGQGLS